MPQPSLAELENELKRDPRSRSFYDLAREYQKLGRFEEARSLCEKGLAVHPSQWQARILLAQIYITQGNLEEGRQMVEKVLLALHDSVPANHLAADIYNALGQRDKALRHYQIVELLEPGRTGVKEHLGELQPAPATAAPVPPPSEVPPPALEPVLQPLEEPARDLRSQPQAMEPEPQPPPPVPPDLEPLSPPAAEPIPALAEDSTESFTVDSKFPQEGSEELSSFAEILEPQADDGVADLMGQDMQLPGSEEEPLTAGTFDTGELPVPNEEEVPESAEATPFPRMSTFTLAELYEKQGYPEKAVEIYQRMLLQDPENAEVHGRIKALMHRIAGEVPEAPVVHQEDVEKALRQKRVMALQGWLRRVREDRHV